MRIKKEVCPEKTKILYFCCFCKQPVKDCTLFMDFYINTRTSNQARTDNFTVGGDF